MTQSPTAHNARHVQLLVPPETCGEACGKAILIGEHAAVDGHPAIALPLKEQFLHVCFGEPLSSSDSHGQDFSKSNSRSDWTAAWSLQFEGQTLELPEVERERLTQSLELAVQLLDSAKPSLSRFSAQKIRIESRIPLGAGMGGSAALSAALIRALAKGMAIPLTNSQIAELSNTLDGFFHGRASGLDAATVVSDSIISFSKGLGSRRLVNKKGFWLLLVDSGERTPTQEMVRRVAAIRQHDHGRVDESFAALAKLCHTSGLALREGDLVGLGVALNEAHRWLQQIEVSSPGLEKCVRYLRDAGALGAKLTGGGGGGLALGIFENQPNIPFTPEWASTPHFLTFVPASKTL